MEARVKDIEDDKVVMDISRVGEIRREFVESFLRLGENGNFS